MKEFTYDISDSLKGLRPDYRVRRLPKPRAAVRCLNLAPAQNGLISRNTPIDPFRLIDGVGLGSVIAAAEGGYGGGAPFNAGDYFGYPAGDPNYDSNKYRRGGEDPINTDGNWEPPGDDNKILPPDSGASQINGLIGGEGRITSPKWSHGNNISIDSKGLITWTAPEVGDNFVYDPNMETEGNWNILMQGTGAVQLSFNNPGFSGGHSGSSDNHISNSHVLAAPLEAGKSYTINTDLSGTQGSISGWGLAFRVYNSSTLRYSTTIHNAAASFSGFTFSVTMPAELTATNQYVEFNFYDSIFSNLAISTFNVIEEGNAYPGLPDPDGWIKQTSGMYLNSFPSTVAALILYFDGLRLVNTTIAGNLYYGSDSVSMVGTVLPVLLVEAPYAARRRFDYPEPQFVKWSGGANPTDVTFYFTTPSSAFSTGDTLVSEAQLYIWYYAGAFAPWYYGSL